MNAQCTLVCVHHDVKSEETVLTQRFALCDSLFQPNPKRKSFICGVISPCLCVPSSSSLGRVMVVRALQCTHTLRPLQCVSVSQALWTTCLCLDRTPEWPWRKPCPPSCSLQAHRSSLPRLRGPPRCWAAAKRPPGSTGCCVGRTTPPAGCRSARSCPRGRRYPQWSRSGGGGRPCSASPGPETWPAALPTYRFPLMDHNSGHLCGMGRSDNHVRLRCRPHRDALSQHGRK